MNERQQIIYMQARLMRLASKEWKKSIEIITELFVNYGVLQYVEDCFGIFHVEGDEAILDDIEIYLKSKGVMYDAEINKKHAITIEKVTAEESKNNAIDLMITMVVDELAEDMQIKPTELLPKFMASETGKLLYDESSKVWWNGPSDIAEMYKAEIANKELNNFFIEGLQGAGKTTFVQRLSDKLKDYTIFREGDYSPVELAWCAYVTEEQYNKILKEYPSLRAEIQEKAVTEDSHKIICYTRILTDVPDFHKNMEKFEIYNGNLDKESFENVIFERFGKWNGRGQIFECSIFQNIIENQMLYFMMTDEEILDFYRRLKNVLAGKTYRIIYLDVEDIQGAIDVIRKERSDDNGNELWFPLMIRYLEESPYGKEHMLTGMDGLIAHLERRKALELRIIEEIFKEESVAVKAKKYSMEDVAALVD